MKIAGTVFFFFVASVSAWENFYKVELNILPTKYLSPQFNAKWSYSDSWSEVSKEALEYREKINYRTFGFKLGRSKYISEKAKVGFEMGILFPVSSHEKRWEIPFFSTGPATTEYNWDVEPSTYSSQYNYRELKILSVPVLAFLERTYGKWDFYFSGGFHIICLEAIETSGEVFEKDWENFEKGHIQQYRTWQQMTKFAPSFQVSISRAFPIFPNVNFKIGAGAGGMMKTRFLFEEILSDGEKIEDGYEIGGVNYNFFAAAEVFF